MICIAFPLFCCTGRQETLKLAARSRGDGPIEHEQKRRVHDLLPKMERMRCRSLHQTTARGRAQLNDRSSFRERLCVLLRSDAPTFVADGG